MRSRTIGMQKSGELKEIIKVVYEQLIHLNILAQHAGFIMDYRANDDMHIWLADKHFDPSYVTVPYFDSAHWNSFNEAKEKGVDFFANLLTFEEKNKFYKDLFKLAPGTTEEAMEYYFSCPGVAVSTVLLENVGLYIENFSGIPYTDEENNTLMRFGKVFQQTYTRFLDLQKAEAQVREAQIEAALERTRTQSMLMQHSTELDDTLRVFHQQVLLLGIHSAFSFLWLPDEKKGRHIFWAAWAEKAAAGQQGENRSTVFKSKAIDYPLDRNEPATAQCLFDWKSDEPVVSYHVPPSAVENYFAAWQELIDGVEQLKPEYFQDGLYYVEAFIKYGCFGVMVEGPLTEEESKILGRLAIEFERAYTRFLDLQKSEAHAREAQIELALERVRAKTMAMQHSAELGETAAEMFRQVEALGVHPWTCGFQVFEKGEKEVTVWMSDPSGRYGSSEKIPLTEDPFFININGARQRKEDLFVMEMGGDELAEHYRYMFNLPLLKKVISDFKDAGFQVPGFQVTHCAFFSQGYLMFVTYEQVPEAWDIFKRLAKVFEQTYTRFLDLQKAEAQAREAQIELSLERVRASAMAMHKTDQLLGAAELLYRELTGLGINSMAITYAIMAADEKSAAYYSINPVDGKINPVPLDLAHTETEVMRSILSSWKKHEAFIKLELDEQATLQHQTYVAEKIQTFFAKHDFDYNFSIEAFLAVSPKQAVIYAFNFAQGYIFIIGSEHLIKPQEEMVTRFTKVFEMTYRRFLDLKQAEDQAREAKIEAALEKVRSRSLAVHQSDEFKGVVKVVFERLQELGLEANAISINTFIENSNDVEVYICSRIESDEHVIHYHLPYFNSLISDDLLAARKSNADFFTKSYSKEDKDIFYRSALELSSLKNAADDVKKMVYDSNSYTISLAITKHSMIVVNDFGGDILSENDVDVIKRFARVFEQAYVRFLDLQKAEAQVRESQIQLALERVRARTMAMQHSDELRDVIKVVFEQLVHLGLDIAHAGFGMDYKKSDDFDAWVADAYQEFPSRVHIPYFDHLQFNSFKNAKAKGIDFFAVNLTYEEKNHWIDHILKNVPGVSEEAKEAYYACPGLAQSTVLMKNVALYVNNHAGVPYSDADNAILIRFGKVFEQTYTRFKDLEHAEAQAREAQIEAALERVRSRTMGMQKSEELREVIQVIYEQLQQLNFSNYSAGFLTDYGETNDFNVWLADPYSSFPNKVHYPYIDHPIFNHLIEAKEKGLDFVAYSLPFEEKNRFLDHALKYLPAPPEDKKHIVEAVYGSAGYAVSVVLMKNVALFIENFEGVPFSDIDNAILMRFGKVFEQTYTRFKDLEQAEAQAREARIEAALEKIRSRTMAMQHSAELQEASLLLFQQAEALGVNAFGCGFNIWDDDWKFATAWMGSVQGLQPPFKTDSSKDVYLPIYDAAKKGESLFVIEQGGKGLETHYQYLATIPTFRDVILKNWTDAGVSSPTFQIIHCAFFAQGYLMFISYEPCPEAYDIFKRFAKVFEQTYTRFLDLQKSEAQARESQIQLALERVRARTMAMQKSTELHDVAGLLFKQVTDMGIKTWTAGFNVWSEDNNSYTDYVTSPLGGFIEPYMVDATQTEVLREVTEARKSGDEFFAQYAEGERLKETYLVLSKFGDKKQYDKMLEGGFQFPAHQYDHFVFGSKVSLMFITFEAVPEAHDIFKRFGKVFEQTYTRFQDLQRAEAQAREAIKQASVDRVRAEIASMRSTKDLERIIPLVWNELTILGVPFIRCGVFIVDDEEQVFHTHLSTPDGKALAVFNLPFDAEGIAQNVLPAWRKKQIATEHWTAEEFAANTKNLVDQGAVKSKGRFVTEHPDTSLDLHFFPFLQGMLYVGNTAPLSRDAMDLGQSLAEAFSTAYARYEDFNKLDVAKQQVDRTLTDLKAAQTQLIQTEKMASLGELTAGIAHEIQNPLNFVNNFSEVNTELLAEMKQEILSGNYEEVSAIADDIIGNEQKISMHGKRADSIVKGMLQHSQSGSGVKEPTNINSVADEYMRLAYHGLRAKDKSFNAEMITRFDPNLPRINVIGQDMGRVMLNLFNNAFYAVNKKRKTADVNYKPEITVATSSENGTVVIRVKDNGIGMPDAIKEKIMQPFFTTKPTGEGTGLGLSLTYDMVVKGHGGTIQVESTDGEGSEFIVSLPV